MTRDSYVGGQAVIEGVMMRGDEAWAVAVRKPDGEIEVRRDDYKSYSSRHRWAGIPFVRGTIALGESLTLGMKALSWSAEKGAVAAGGESGADSASTESSDRDGEAETLSKGAIALSMTLALIFFVGVFILTPTLITRVFVDRVVHHPVLANLAEGGIRLAIFIGYIAAISLLPDIRRVFQYHGAEHKTIAAYEYGDRLVPEAVERYSTRHVRCGTSFLLIVMVLAIVVYSFLGRPPLIWRLASRVVLIPVIAGISYEVIRLAARHIRSKTVRVLMAPGLALQGLTTREPSREQLEVAIESLRAVLPKAEWNEVRERPVLEEAIAIPA